MRVWILYGKDRLFMNQTWMRIQEDEGNRFGGGKERKLIGRDGA